MNICSHMYMFLTYIRVQEFCSDQEQAHSGCNFLNSYSEMIGLKTPENESCCRKEEMKRVIPELYHNMTWILCNNKVKVYIIRKEENVNVNIHINKSGVLICNIHIIMEGKDVVTSEGGHPQANWPHTIYTLVPHPYYIKSIFHNYKQKFSIIVTFLQTSRCSFPYTLPSTFLKLRLLVFFSFRQGSPFRFLDLSQKV